MTSERKGRPAGRPPGVLIGTMHDYDPRLSGPQRKALDAAATADRRARLLGLDAHMRPVVAATLGNPPELRTYALLRNGDPTAPAWDEESPSFVLREEWWEEDT